MTDQDPQANEFHVPEDRLEQIRAKYREERDKRRRPDGRAQFAMPQDVLASLLDDPFNTPVEREPLADDVDVAIIGAGFGGLMAGARLRELGLEKIRLIDRAGDVGGTWYWNRYPGARCDVESYIYMPLLEETGYVPTEKFTTGTELLEHARRIARQYDLYKDACFDTEIAKLEWDEDALRWIVHTTRGDRMRARFVVNSPGPMQRAHLPAIPGIPKFKGKAFLTSRWDFEYTKGDVLGDLTGLSDKKVALIGTGATAVQVMPMLAAHSEHLYVVQRTPTPVGPRPNPPTDLEWFSSLAPGWQEERMASFAALTTGGDPDAVDLVDDEWTRHFKKVQAAGRTPDRDERKLALELVDLARDEFIRKRVGEVVKDPATAESLKHYYRYFCKRPTFSATYLESFNRPNVTLLDTDGRGLDEITEDGIVLHGREYEVDCIVYASGFETDHDYHTRSGFDIVGRDGLSLADKWADGARTLHSVTTHGFPNLFLLGAAQGGFYLNFVNRLNEDLKLVSHIMDHALSTGAVVVDTTREGEDAWVEEIKRHAFIDLDFIESCTPGQYNNWGQEITDRYLQNRGYGLGAVALEKLLRDWREEGSLKGISFS